MILLLIICIVSYGLLVILTAIEPHRSALSSFELNRRKNIKETDAVFQKNHLRERHYDDILAWLRIKAGLLLVLFVLCSVAALQWFVGSVIAVIGVLEYVALARLPFVQRHSQGLYDRYEDFLLQLADRYGNKLRFLRGVARQPSAPLPLSSREELLHLVANAGAILTQDEKRLIKSNILFTDQQVVNYMTPRSVIDYVKSDDTIGPLLLDELYKTGHNRFPVIGDDIDHVIGMLYLRDVSTIDAEAVHSAADMMKTPVYYIKDTQTLGHALAAFLRVRHHLFVVVNEYRETVGILSLEDVIEAMLGRKIVDEFDAHEDLRAVAARNVRANNTPKHHRDV